MEFNVRDYSTLHEFGLDIAGLDSEFQPGDIVELSVGGPDMVVLSMCDCGMVEVAWAEDGKVRIEVFPDEALIDV